MSHPTLDAAIAALLRAARAREAESIMTTDEVGNTLILIGAEEDDPAGRLSACILQLTERKKS